MIDISPSVFFNFFLYLFIPFLAGYIAKRLKFQPLIGYIIGGLIFGNLLTGVISKESIVPLANFGIILLLFMVGLEINFEKILVLKKFIIIGGFLQIILSILFVSLISPLFGFSLIQSLLIGIAFSSSSTVLVAKIIEERGEESSFIGELTMGMLMFQDLAFIPFIIIFNFLNGQSSPLVVLTDIVLGILQASVILILMYYIGRKVIPHIFDRVARSSRDLLNLFIILFIFLICYLSSLLGIPVVIGAFVAGVLVSQTTEHYHIFSQLRPLRDIIAVIFFVYIGTNISVGSTIPLFGQVILFGTVVILIKLAVIIAICFYLRFNSRITISMAILLFQIDEDAFILLSVAYGNHLFSTDQFNILISTVLISLILTPIFISRKDTLYVDIRRFIKRFIPPLDMFIHHRMDSDPTSIDAFDIKHHIIICGYGRIGQHIGRALMNANVPFIAIDYNFHTVQKVRKEGVNIIFGDSTDRDILDYAEIEHAIALVSVVPDRFSQEAIILSAKKLNPNIVVISRVHKHSHQQRLKDLGANVVVEPELEASLSIIKQIFYLKGLSKEERLQNLHHFKLEQGMG